MHDVNAIFENLVVF